MVWRKCRPPSKLRSCDCGSDVVEQSSDGLVWLYRCGACQTSLGDLTMGHEP